MRTRVGVAWLTAVLVIGGSAAGAGQPSQEAPVVRIESVAPVVISYSCGDIDPSVESGEVVVARTGDVTGALTVTYELTGTGMEGPADVTFAAGEQTASIPVAAFGGDSGPIELTLVDGEGYDLGDPAAIAVEVDDSAVEEDCPPYRPPEPPTVEPDFTG